MNVFLSQPMNGLTDEEIIATRDKYLKYLQEKYGDVELIDSFNHPDAPEDAGPLWYLGRSIQLMADADMVCFVPGWRSARGCVVEELVASKYGINTVMLSKYCDNKYSSDSIVEKKCSNCDNLKETYNFRTHDNAYCCDKTGKVILLPDRLYGCTDWEEKYNG